MTSRLSLPPAISVGPDPGTVSVQVPVPVPPQEAWDALVGPSHARQWFGDLSGELRAGVPARVEFGDGDFFEIDVVSVEPPTALALRWRFLGIGPRCEVRWRVHGDAQTHVEVRDSAPNRAAAESEELGSGWADFLERYRDYLSTGSPTRYPWRAELDGSIELSDSRRWLLDAEVRPKWLPLAHPRGGPATVLKVATTDTAGTPEPRWLRVERITRSSATRLDLVLARGDGPPVSTCRLELGATSAGGSLSFTHHRWEQLLAAGEDRRVARARLTRTWVDALVRARGLLGS